MQIPYKKSKIVLSLILLFISFQLITTAQSNNNFRYLNNAIKIKAGENIQAYVDKHPDGTVFKIEKGVYHEQSVSPKNGNIFIGKEGVIMDGNLKTMYAFSGNANDVVIDGFEIMNYGPATLPDGKGSFDGAINAVSRNSDQDKSARWTVRNCNVHNNQLCGIFLCDGGQIINNKIHHNRQMGVKLYYANSGLVEGNEIAFNNNMDEDNTTKGHFDRYWESGGTKFAWTNNLVVKNNYVHDNDGPGLWTDIDNVNTLYQNNLVEDNSGIGIFHEISYSAVIRNNVVRRNGNINRGWLWEAGILIAASSDVEVYNNIVEDNFNGITGILQNRGSGKHGARTLDNVYIHDNTIVVSANQKNGFVQEDNPDLFERNIIIENNSYTSKDNTPLLFGWDNKLDLTYTEWLKFHPKDKK